LTKVNDITPQIPKGWEEKKCKTKSLYSP